MLQKLTVSVLLVGLQLGLMPGLLSAAPRPRRSPAALPPSRLFIPASSLCTLMRPIRPLSLLSYRMPSLLANSADEPLASVAVQYAAIAQVDRALGVITSVKDPFLKATKLVEIANLQPPQAARSTLALALKTARSLKNNYDYDAAMIEIAQGYVTAGDFKTAMQLARSLKENASRVEALTQVALKSAAVGQSDQARQAILTISGRDAQETAMNQLALQYAKAGDYEQAFRVSRSQRDGAHRSTLSDLMWAALDSGKTSQFAQLIELERDDCARYEAAESAARGRLFLDKSDRSDQVKQRLSLAVTIAQSIQDSNLKENVLATIAAESAKQGQIESALQISQTLPDGSRKDQALVEIARHYLKLNQPDTALKIANTIKTSTLLATLLPEIAKRYTQAGQPEKASPLLSQALDLAKSINASPFASPIPSPRIPSFPTNPIISPIPPAPSLRESPPLR
ncbi:tetratricopeptide repeat protein [Phormidesmis sp. 146-12]